LAQQGSPPGRSPRQPGRGRRGYDPLAPAERPARADRHVHAGRRDHAERQARRPGWDQQDAFGPDTDADLPAWAGLSVHPTRAGGARLRPRPPVDDYADGERADAWEGEERPEWPDEEPRPAGAVPAGATPAGRASRRMGRRAAMARLRRSRRRVYLWCGVAILACVVAASVVAVVTSHTPARAPYVTSLQHGEFKSVADSCTAVSPAVLSQFLPSAGKPVAAASSSTDSECTFTVDRKPNFLVLTVEATSYQPFAAASGDGSASDNASDQFGAAQAVLAHPAKRSPLAPASVKPLAGLGKKAFDAVANEHVGHIASEVVTVGILYRNLIITIGLSGQESGGFGPVQLGTLQAGAQAVARSVLAVELKQPTA
jgi:hypothetical protein